MNGNIPRDAEGRPLGRQEQLLLLIEQYCQFDDNGVLQRYYVPHTRPETIQVGRERFDIGFVSGSGDASALRAMERKGWIQPQRAGRYSYSITEEGKLKAQEIA